MKRSLFILVFAAALGMPSAAQAYYYGSHHYGSYNYNHYNHGRSGFSIRYGYPSHHGSYYKSYHNRHDPYYRKGYHYGYPYKYEASYSRYSSDTSKHKYHHRYVDEDGYTYFISPKYGEIYCDHPEKRKYHDSSIAKSVKYYCGDAFTYSDHDDY